MTNPPDPRPVNPPSGPSITDLRDAWVDSFLPAVEDTALAIEWHGDTYGNDSLDNAIALWVGVPVMNEERVAKRAKELRDLIDDIVRSYAEEVLWPKHLESIKRGGM